MNEYIGNKFYYKEKRELDYKNWFDNKKEEKKVYELSWGYKKYLEEKRIKELEEKAVALRHKLIYQEKVYGSIDEFDFMEYEMVLKALGYKK